MSREILFRGKRIKTGKWGYGNLIHAKGKTFVGEEEENIFWMEAEVYPGTVGQFTGFCDKHGVRIFEGDKFTDPTGDIYTVKWEEHSGVWEFFSKDGSFLFVMECFDMFEVIGNIYDKEEQDALQGKFVQDGRCTFDE